MNRHLPLCLVLLTAVAGATSLGACSSDNGGNTSSNTTAGNPGGTGTGGAGGAGGGSTSSSGEGGDIFSSGATTTTTGSPEICDGIDNDGDGIIDNVDVGGDGICDCLAIATLGVRGSAGIGDVFNTWLNDRSDNGAIDLNDAVLTPQLLAPYQVIVAQNLSQIGRAYSPDEIAALEGWIRNGGGLITLIGYADTSERTNVNSLLAPFDVSYGPEPILPKQGGTTIPITDWTTHPTTAGVSAVGFDNGYPVNGDAEVIATKDGWVVARAKTINEGHLFLWGDEWITFDSEWQDHPEYQVEHYWVNLIKWLTRESECQVPIPPQ
ncbi:hypothetical protein [Chondromyces crocatus]|uniref:Dockerin domain-containing protein n=1 Tax=Chondromyces crocatus TaxID=52 RepID=A0A0K1EBB6_CHOCO|nr:hypothetical protein [Chondromyces crocatus]AKT38150.1 uncharacterized protein CMC5_022930 [Chondromyces crocatus]